MNGFSAIDPSGLGVVGSTGSASTVPTLRGSGLGIPRFNASGITASGTESSETQSSDTDAMGLDPTEFNMSRNQAGPSLKPALGARTTAETAASSIAVPEPRLVRAAHEFEAAMMKELMSPLVSGHDSLGGSFGGNLGDDGEEEGSSSALTAFAGEALAKAISERGGLGVAKSIIKQLSAHGNHSGKSPVPSIPNRDTLKSRLK